MNQLAVVGKMAFGASLFASASTLFAAPQITLPFNQQVTVVNPPANPVPVTGNVGVSGTPTVKINSVTPVSVRDADYPARHAFRTQCAMGFNISNPSPTCGLTSVPSGKVLVIETVTTTSSRPSGSEAILELVFVGTNSKSNYYLAQTLQGTADGTDYFAATLPVHLYADSDTEVRAAILGPAGTPAPGIAFLSISGYLVDAAP